MAGLGPEPGDIYREYTKNLYESTWRVTDPKSTAAGAKEFLPNPVMNLKIEDLEGALRAELVIDRWGGHPGTRDKWVRFNDNDWLVVPELATPKYPTSMVSQDNPIIEVPLEHINEGSNTFNGTCSMLSHWWGQWGWYGIVLRVYFDESKPHPTGRITSPADGGEFGEFPLVAAEASSDAGIARVDFLGWYDSYDVDGDGYYTGWQHYYYGTNITEHLGTAKQGPYKVEWDTEWVPDQEPGSIKMLARIRDNNGYWYVTEAVEGLSLVRDTVSVQLYKAYNLPRRFIARAGNDLSCLIDLPETEPLGMIKKVGLHLRTWNGLDQKIRVNNVYAGLVPGRNHKFSYAVREISPDLPAPGENKISFRNDTEQHGCEVLWPGPGLTIRYKVFQPEKDATCDFNGDGAAGLDDLIDMVLLAHRYRYDPRTDWNRDGHFEVNDVVMLLRDIMEGTCPDASVLLAAEGNPGPVTRLEGLSAEDIAYVERMMAQMNLTLEQEAAFHLALYGQAGAAKLPNAFALKQNLPNPFNPATTISYGVPEGTSVHVTLKVYDIRGSLVRTLVDEVREAGSYSVFWDGRDDTGSQVASGVYLYRMQAGDYVQTRKMVLLK